MKVPRSALLPSTLVLLSGLLSACQKSDDHPPFAAGCEKNCSSLPGISVGTGRAGGSSMDPDEDAGTGTLQGQVLLLDDSFATSTLYGSSAVVSADGANGSPVTADWRGAASDPFVLEGVARMPTNWVSIKPKAVGGEAMLTYQGVRTSQAANVDLNLVSSNALDNIFGAVSTLRSGSAGQVVLFFRSAGTNMPLAGLHVTMLNAQVAIYSAASRWVLDDGTAVTDASGLVVFGNVDDANSGGTQLVTVTRAATPNTPAVAAGQFPVKVVQEAATIASVGVQL